MEGFAEIDWMLSFMSKSFSIFVDACVCMFCISVSQRWLMVFFLSIQKILLILMILIPLNDNVGQRASQWKSERERGERASDKEIYAKISELIIFIDIFLNGPVGLVVFILCFSFSHTLSLCARCVFHVHFISFVSPCYHVIHSYATFFSWIDQHVRFLRFSHTFANVSFSGVVCSLILFFCAKSAIFFRILHYVEKKPKKNEIWCK